MKVHIVNRAATLTAQPGENLLKLLQRPTLLSSLSIRPAKAAGRKQTKRFTLL